LSASACDGLRILDFSQGMSGPLATMILADHGADVCKVEPAGGDWARQLPGFSMWNRGKTTCSLDLRSAPDLARVAGMAREADVVVHDWHPKTASARGLDGRSLRRADPRIITCAITAAPAGRPDICSAGYDATIAALAGRMVGLDPLSGAAPGQDREAPLFTAAPTAAYGAAMLAVQGILAALHRRHATGVGLDVSTSLVQAEAAFLMRQDLARGGPDRPGLPGTPPAVHRGIVLSFLTAECKDGRYIQMCARQDAHFRNWMRALDLAEVMDDPRYAAAPLGIRKISDIEELEHRIRQRMLQKTQAQWMELFSGPFDVGADPFLTPEEFLSHPQMLANDRVVTLTGPDRGELTMPGPLVLMSDTPARIERAAPPAAKLGLAPQLTSPTDRQGSGRSSKPGAGGTSHLGSDEPAAAAGPLAGLTILEIAYFVAGPLSATLLAELGARIIKVEPIEGDPSRRTGLQNSKFLAGKESIALDLKSDAGRQILQSLLARSDALVHNFRPGVPERLGFGYEEAIRANPRLVYLYAASYGSRGPQAHRTAFHSTPNALCGGGILQAGQGNPPVDDSYCDPGSGLAAATALLLGLTARAVTGRGQYLETSMLSSAAYVHSNDMVLDGGRAARPEVDQGQHGIGPCYRLYRCRTGWVFLSAWRDRDFRRFTDAVGAEWAGNADFSTGAGRRAAADELTEALSKLFAGRDASQWTAQLALPESILVEVSEVPLERWFEEQDLLLPMEHPEFGPYWQPPAKLSFDDVARPASPTCSLGEHTGAILAELGYDAGQVRALQSAGAVFAPGN
jgi:crotonobetainyl-CoA:carnitine CoA-transferase CaiB-like acyl-CoA transferase